FLFFLFFFFQAEDGIRDLYVTGVQTCALPISGAVTFDGVALLNLADRELRDLRGDRLAMIFQEPMTSLNPSYTIGEQIVEVLVRHRGLSEAQAREKAIALLRRAGIPSPAERIDDYPHKLSG